MLATLEQPKEEAQFNEDDLNRVKDDIRFRLLDDFDFYSSNALKIFPKSGQLSPFIMKEAQRFIHQIVEKQLKEQGYVRIILLKPRQIGSSTYWEGRFFWKIVHSQGKRVMIVTEAEDSRNNLFDMVKTFYEYLPDDIKPSIKQLNEKALLFRYPEGKGGLNCRYTVKTCDSKGMVGITSHFVHISEYGRFKESSINNISGLIECVPSDEDSIMGTEIVYESTAEGARGCFYNKWKKCERGEADKDYIRVFIPWFWYEGYRWKVNEEEAKEIMTTLDEHEEWLLKQVNPNGQPVIVEHLAWRRRKIDSLVPDLGYTNEEFFKQWYPATAEEAFVFGGQGLFNQRHLDTAKWECCSPITTGNFNLGNNKFETVRKGLIKIWEKPIRNVKYVIGADVAEGLIDGDYSCGDVIKLPEMVQVAHIHGHIDPDLFGLYLNCLGRYYNNALLGPEVNSMGHTVLATLQRKRYPNLFQREVTDSVGLGRKTRKSGWVTGKGTKFRIISQLNAVLRDGCSGVLNTDTINEFGDFIRNEDGTYGALLGSYDDRVLSYAIAIEMAYSAPGARRIVDRNNRIANRMANRENIGSIN